MGRFSDVDRLPYRGQLRHRGRYAELRRKCLSLGMGELSALIVFALVPLVGLRTFVTAAGALVALWFALLPLLFVLLQAGAYWLLARRWVGGELMPIPLARTYAGLRVVNPLVLAVGLIGLLFNLPTDPLAIILVTLAWGFGVVEYVNYFIVRVSYPVTAWAASVGQWRTPRLIRDVRAALHVDNGK